MTPLSYNFLIIDDEEERRIYGYAESLKRVDPRIQIQVFKPSAFEEQLEKLKRNGERFGLILDNKLDERPPTPNSKPRSYRGLTVAQEIRTRATGEAVWLDWTYPIVMLSMQAYINNFYAPDLTGHDLFDAIYAKENVARNATQMARELVSLVDGYIKLRQVRAEATAPESRLGALLGENIGLKRLDPRIQATLTGSKHPCHVDAQFILNMMIHRPGPLISEPLLAARLGVDRAQSQDWAVLCDKLEFCRYKGVFYEGWERWWARELEHWWRQRPSRPPALRMLAAEERVQILQKELGLRSLVAAKPLQPSYETRYWTICSETEQPLDQADAVRIAEPEPEPWQEHRYLSLGTALNGLSKFEIHSLEVDRIEALRREAEDDV